MASVHLCPFTRFKYCSDDADMRRAAGAAPSQRHAYRRARQESRQSAEVWMHVWSLLKHFLVDFHLWIRVMNCNVMDPLPICIKTCTLTFPENHWSFLGVKVQTCSSLDFLLKTLFGHRMWWWEVNQPRAFNHSMVPLGVSASSLCSRINSFCALKLTCSNCVSNCKTSCAHVTVLSLLSMNTQCLVNYVIHSAPSPHKKTSFSKFSISYPQNLPKKFRVLYLVPLCWMKPTGIHFCNTIYLLCPVLVLCQICPQSGLCQPAWYSAASKASVCNHIGIAPFYAYLPADPASLTVCTRSRWKVPQSEWFRETKQAPLQSLKSIDILRSLQYLPIKHISTQSVLYDVAVQPQRLSCKVLVSHMKLQKKGLRIQFIFLVCESNHKPMKLRQHCNSSVKFASGTSSDTGRIATVARLVTPGRSIVDWPEKRTSISPL